MRALLSSEPGGPETLRIVDVPRPVANAGQVLLEVKACGVNYPDFLTIQNKYQIKVPRPFSPGAEVAGIVAEVGPGVKEPKIGDQVAARIGTGGMAEFVAIDAVRCSKMPPGMSFSDAAVMQFTFETAYYALKTRASLRQGETVLVLGASGGVGVAAVQIARNLGARVVAAASSENKIAFAIENGASDGVVYSTEQPDDVRETALKFKAAVGKSGAGVVFDPVGGWLSDPAFRSLGENGRHLVVGFTGGIPSISLNLPLLKNCNILGVNWRTFVLQQAAENNLNRAVLQSWYKDGLLSPGITAVYALEQGGEAIQLLADRIAVGKVVVTI